jgi:Flp pilus assembly protein TadG
MTLAVGVLKALTFPLTTAALRNLLRARSISRVVIWWAAAAAGLRGRARAAAAVPALSPVRRTEQGERGQAVIEFALLFPIFVLFLLVMVDLGIAMDHRLVMQHAVSEGVREAAVNSNVGSDVGKIQDTTAKQSQGLVTTSDVNVCYIDGDDLGNSIGDVTDGVQVSALYSYTFAGELLSAFGVSPPAITMEPVYSTALQTTVAGANACPP